MIPKPGRHSRQKQPRPRTRTLKAVHDAILEDLAYPSEVCHTPKPPTQNLADHEGQITGKRMRQNTDGSRVHKVFLDAKDATSLEHKLDSFSSVYHKLTGKTVQFMFEHTE